LNKNKNSKIFKSGYVGLIGRTNTGKSTLINNIVGRNAVITSDKAQTTRNRINCIYNTPVYQAVFVDCPGFFKPRNLLGKKLNSIIYEVLSDVDVICAVVDAAAGIGRGDRYVFEQVKNKSKPSILVLNKIDLLPDSALKELPGMIHELKKEYNFFKDILIISARTGENVSGLLDMVSGMLPAGPKYFPDNMVTDMPLAKMVSEIIREKLSENLFEELPHSVSVAVENMVQSRTSGKEDITRIECSIYVEKKSHKAMIIGKSGANLKKTGELSRMELESFLGTKVYLELWVKVLENWTKNEHYINKLGYA
jgi:GTP-binding protein Era